MKRRRGRPQILTAEDLTTVEPGHHYATLVIRIPLTAGRKTTLAKMLMEEQLYLPDVVGQILNYSASASVGLNHLQIDEKKSNWIVE